jgi:predicted histidine transporter YuiF (NhaC family)
MIQTTIKRLSYKIRHEFLTINTLVIAGAAIITLGWVIGSLDVMQRNYERQRTLDQKTQQQQLIDLETRNLELETAQWIVIRICVGYWHCW